MISRSFTLLLTAAMTSGCSAPDGPGSWRSGFVSAGADRVRTPGPTPLVVYSDWTPLDEMINYEHRLGDRAHWPEDLAEETGRLWAETLPLDDPDSWDFVGFSTAEEIADRGSRTKDLRELGADVDADLVLWSHAAGGTVLEIELWPIEAIEQERGLHEHEGYYHKHTGPDQPPANRPHLHHGSFPGPFIDYSEPEFYRQNQRERWTERGVAPVAVEKDRRVYYAAFFRRRP